MRAARRAAPRAAQPTPRSEHRLRITVTPCPGQGDGGRALQRHEHGFVFALAGAVLFAMGVAGVVLIGHLLRRILAFNLMGSGAFLVLVGLAQRHDVADPVPQAMVLTGIVVAVAATALALALVRKFHALSGQLELPDDVDE